MLIQAVSVWLETEKCVMKNLDCVDLRVELIGPGSYIKSKPVPGQTFTRTFTRT